MLAQVRERNNQSAKKKCWFHFHFNFIIFHKRREICVKRSASFSGTKIVLNCLNTEHMFCICLMPFRCFSHSHFTAAWLLTVTWSILKIWRIYPICWCYFSLVKEQQMASKSHTTHTALPSNIILHTTPHQAKVSDLNQIQTVHSFLFGIRWTRERGR